MLDHLRGYVKQHNNKPDDKASVADRLNERDYRKVDDDLLVDLEHRLDGVQILAYRLIALPSVEISGVCGNGNAENGSDGIRAEKSEKANEVKGDTERKFTSDNRRYLNIRFQIFLVLGEGEIGNAGNVADDYLIIQRSGEIGVYREAK